MQAKLASILLRTGGAGQTHFLPEAKGVKRFQPGSARITCLDQYGKPLVDDVKQGDLWFFPTGYPHSIQGLVRAGRLRVPYRECRTPSPIFFKRRCRRDRSLGSEKRSTGSWATIDQRSGTCRVGGDNWISETGILSIRTVYVLSPQ
jgi:hypothetical protein